MKIDGLEMLKALKVLKKRQNRYLALLLSDIEEVMDSDSEEFEAVRKYVLDYFNDYTRMINQLLLGDNIEGLTFR